MAIIQDWKISNRGAQCSHTTIPFEDGDEFFTCIFDDAESDGFIRRDFSKKAWQEIEPNLETKPFSFWKSTFKVPEKTEKKDAFEKNSAEGMLRKMVEIDDPRTENARYILALMLERKKTLIPTDVQETETRKLLFYEHKDTGEVFIVADPQLKLAEIESVQIEVADLMAGKPLDGVPVDTETTEATETENEAAPVSEAEAEAETTADSDSEAENEADESSSDDASIVEVSEESSEPHDNTAEDSGEEAAQAENDAVPDTGETGPEPL